MIELVEVSKVLTATTKLSKPPTISPRRTLTTLPPELLLLVYDNLRPAAKLALSLTTRSLYLNLPILASSSSSSSSSSKLPPPPPTLTPCALKAITISLSYPHQRKNRKYCIHCSQWYPHTLFGNPWSPQPNETNTESREKEDKISDRLLEDGVDTMGGPGMINLPEGICGWHRGAFVQLVDSAPSSPSITTASPTHRGYNSRYPLQTSPVPAPFPGLEEGWWCIPSVFCTHCKKITTPFRLWKESLNTSASTSTSTSASTSTCTSKEKEKVDSITAFCKKMVLWGTCPQCPGSGCKDCRLIKTDVFVRKARGYIDAVRVGQEGGVDIASAGHFETDVTKVEGDEVFSGDPGRFVVYRRDGRVMVREWESSELI